MNNSNKLIFFVIFAFALVGCKTNDSQSLSSQALSDETFSPEYAIAEHPLINKTWSISEQKYITSETLEKLVLTQDVILLGETHDNARHHLLQAQFIKFLVKNQRSPSIAFEMLDRSQQDIINEYQSAHQQSITKTDDFSQLIQWQDSGWPDWPYYRPVFYQSIENNLPVIAANLELKIIRKAIKQGSSVLDQEYQDLLKKYQYNDQLKQELEQDILSAHCDMLPETMLSPMLMGQQVRDISMSQAILTTLDSRRKDSQKNNDAVVLIAGSGHARNDYGVPWYLQQEAPELKIISIAFIEVSEDEFQPKDYAEAWNTEKLPFDYVWFTPKTEREDQCEKMKAYMKKKK